MLLLKSQMPNSKSQIIFWSLFIFWSLGFVILPKPALATTLEFEDQTWEVSPLPGHRAINLFVRNDQDFKILAISALLGSSPFIPDSLLDEPTAAKINEIAAKINQADDEARLTLVGCIGHRDKRVVAAVWRGPVPGIFHHPPGCHE